MANFNDLLTINTFSAGSYPFFPPPAVSLSGYAFKNKQVFNKEHHKAVFRRQQVYGIQKLTFVFHHQEIYSL